MGRHCCQHPYDARLKSVLKNIHYVLSQGKAHSGTYCIYNTVKLVVKGRVVPAAPVQDEEFAQLLYKSHNQHILDDQVYKSRGMQKIKEQPVKEALQYPYGENGNDTEKGKEK